MASITKVSGKSYRVCTDAENDAYDELSFKTDAGDVSFTDGTDAETNLSAIKGITSDISCEDESIAASAVAVKTLNDSLQWKKIDIDYTIPNTNTSYHTIGTYEELINCKEIIIQSSEYQNYFINNGDEIMFRQYQAAQIANDSYVSEYGFKVNFLTGLVSGRQYIKGSSTNYGVLTAIYYR